MNNMLNHELSRNPTNIDIPRSRFDRNSQLKTTFSEGELIPIFVDEVLPGDTFTMDTSFLIRMSTPIRPVMDNAYIDVYYFFVPNRLVWDHWQEFCGENTSAPWAQQTEYLIPQLKFDTNNSQYSVYGAIPGSVADYIGVPSFLQYDALTVSDLPNRAYRLIWNEFFRDQNLQYPVAVYTDDSDRSYTDDPTDPYNDTVNYAGRPLHVNKYHDYFTSCLPGTQKWSGALPLDMSLFSNGLYGTDIPVRTWLSHDTEHYDYSQQLNRTWPATYYSPDTSTYNYYLKLVNDDPSAVGESHYTVDGQTSGSTDAGITLAPDNLWADVSSLGVSINGLRQAFAVQRLFEKDARGGTRYREMLRAHFGVISPDSRVQVPEYLGGTRVPINMDQVLQTSSTDSVSPQGNTAAYSMTTSSDNSFTKSFVEHGLLIGLACVRVQHSYSQGVERFLSRKRRFDFYYPALANIGEQAVLKKEIYAAGRDVNNKDSNGQYDDDVFGYQEAWAEYRYKPSRLSGAFKSTGQGQSSLAAAWTYADYYTDYPTLSDMWMYEGDSNIGNTLATGSSEPQFIADFFFKLNCTRPMPLYSIPGLIDHH